MYVMEVHVIKAVEYIICFKQISTLEFFELSNILFVMHCLLCVNGNGYHLEKCNAATFYDVCTILNHGIGQRYLLQMLT